MKNQLLFVCCIPRVSKQDNGLVPSSYQNSNAALPCACPSMRRLRVLRTSLQVPSWAGPECVPVSQSPWSSPISDTGCLCTLSGASSNPSSGWTLLLLQGWQVLALGLTGGLRASSKGWLTLAMPLVALGRCGSSHEQCCSAGDGSAAWVPLAYFFI